MQLVINIDDKIYRHIVSMQFCMPGLRSGKSLLEEILKAIRNGTPLPKGHGRLIDTDTLKKSLFYDNRQAFTKHQVWLMFSKYNTKVPTVLEAERRKEEENDGTRME